MLPSRTILWDIHEEHLDEAAFLWGQWERAMNAANYTLDEVIDGPEGRLRAHLDALVLGSKPVAEKLLIPALADDDEGKVTTAAWVLLHAEDADHLDLVFDALVKAEKKEARAALARAFELAERPELADRLRPRLEGSVPPVQAMIVNVLGARVAPVPSGQSPAWGFAIEAFLESRHQDLLLAALRALCRAPDPVCTRLVEKPLASPYVEIRDAAIEAGIRLGMPAARTACSKLVARNAAGSRFPLAVLATGGEPVDVAAIIRKLDVESMRRDALWALGFAGTVQAAEAVLAWIGDDVVDKVAGEAFAAMTGVRIAGPLAEVGQTDNGPPSESEGDDDVPLPVILPEDNLPVPNTERLFAWWNKAGARFAPDARYLYGQPRSPEVLRGALSSGPMWRRRAWNLELAARGQRGVDIGTWACRQRT
ncbi:MAG TPA: TIGR02270 family protein [Polyangia bacterium]|jgi:uncharacterized protein (TIGR02270 family)